MSIEIQEFVRATASALANGWWQGIVLVGFVVGALFVAERSGSVSAATRYAVRLAALVVFVALHVMVFATALAPDRIDASAARFVPDRLDASAARFAPDRLDATAAARHAAPAGAFTPEWLEAPAGFVASTDPAVPVGPSLSAITRPDLAAERGWAREPATTRIAIGPDAARVTAWGLVLLWFATASIGLARLAGAMLRLGRMKRRGRPIVSGAVVGRRRTAVVMESDEVASPVAAGYWNPAILIPTGLESSLSAAEFEQVLMHESGHVERYDDWTMLAQRFVEAIFLMNPAAKWLGDGMSRDREMACDEWVVLRSGNPVRYAHTLARLAEMRMNAESLAPGMPGSHLKERIRRLVASGSGFARFRRDQVVTAVALIALVGTVMAMQVPGLRFQRWAHGKQIAPEVVDVPLELESPLEVEFPLELESPPEPELPPEPEFPLELESPLDLKSAMDQGSATIPPLAPFPPVPAMDIPVDVAPADLSVASWIRILEAAGRISSSGDASRVFLLAAGRMPDDSRVTAAYRAAAANISSRGDRERVLRALDDR